MVSNIWTFQATISNFVDPIPQEPMMETWEWATDIIRHNDGSEQRIMLRSQPRRTFNYEVITTAIGQTRAIAESLFSNAGFSVKIP